MQIFNLEEEVFIATTPSNIIDYDVDGNILKGYISEIQKTTTIDMNGTNYRYKYEVSIMFESMWCSDSEIFRSESEAKTKAIELVSKELVNARARIERLEKCLQIVESK